MTGLVRKAMLLSACGLFMAGAAMAGLPNAGNSTCNGGDCDGTPVAPVTIVIADADNPDAACHTASFTIRDAAGDPVPGVDVVLEFFTCAGINQPSVCLSQPDPGVIVSAVNKTITKNADGPGPTAGQVTFRIWGDGTLTGESSTCVRVYAASQLLSTGIMKWRLKRYDLNDAGDIVNAADAGLWVDLVLPPSGGASDLWGDYTCNDLTNSADSGAMLRASLPPTGLAVCNGPYW